MSERQLVRDLAGCMKSQRASAGCEGLEPGDPGLALQHAYPR